MNIDMDSVIVSSLTEHCYGPSSSLPLFSPLLLLLLTPSLLPFYSCFLTSNPSHSLSFPHLSILTPSLLTTPLTSLLSSPLFRQLTLFCILYPVSSLLQDSLEVAKRVKEMHSYVCSDLSKEFQRFDEKPDKYFKSYEGIRVRELYHQLTHDPP